MKMNKIWLLMTKKMMKIEITRIIHSFHRISMLIIRSVPWVKCQMAQPIWCEHVILILELLYKLILSLWTVTFMKLLTVLSKFLFFISHLLILVHMTFTKKRFCTWIWSFKRRESMECTLIQITNRWKTL